ncbi:hypothetical protein GCM10009720_19850 [Yaniella flava]|uniref:Methionine/alanine importer small subunit n=1 Tax=Yaniella flava TaxID=287930 RepID=A0ABP5G3W5_9MICC|nr:methionine/alanine import family NSS transporter small subunit [Micrococcaceae bacterium]
MTGISITMMIIALVTVWGGIIVSMIHLQRNPDELSGELADEE